MIFVNGGSRKQRDVAYDVASFCYNELIPRIRKCEIEINIKKMKGYEGTCIDTDDREYEIEVNKNQSLEDLCVTLCHEMVHVKQYAKDELHEYEPYANGVSAIYCPETGIIDYQKVGFIFFHQ